MSYTESLLKENRRESENTLRILNRFQDSYATWKPHPKSMPALDMAKHVVQLHLWLKQAIQKNEFDFLTDIKPMHAETFEDLQNLLERGRDDNEKFIKESGPGFWDDSFILRAGDHIIMNGTRKEAVRYVLFNHLIHHRGQLSVYLRMLEIPVPGIYGPSADEQ